MYTYDYAEATLADDLEIALSSTALFDQYDEVIKLEAANDDEYDNLYPFIG